MLLFGKFIDIKRLVYSIGVIDDKLVCFMNGNFLYFEVIGF